MDFIFEQLVSFKKFYHKYVFVFTASYIFYSFLCLLTIINIISFILFDINNNSFLLFLFSINIVIFLIHGMHGLIHVLEDYTFDIFCKIFFVFLSNLILFKILFLIIF